MKQADLGLILRPGTDAALACAVMHVPSATAMPTATTSPATPTIRQGWRRIWRPARRNGRRRSPASVEEIEAFARLVGTTPRSFFRLGYGFTRSATAPSTMHAALSVAVVLGSWQYEGGGAFHNNGAIFGLNKSMIEGSDARPDPPCSTSRASARPDRGGDALGGGAGDGAADPEHQSGERRARAAAGEAGLRCATTCSSACTSSS
jgi:anaerobic selenocysteine-containing dehydrogenase